MSRVFSVARVLLLQAWADKVLLLVLPWIAGLFVAFSFPVSFPGEQESYLRHAGLELSVILAVFALVGTAARHTPSCVARKELAMVLAAPVRRLAWISGQLLGLAVLAAGVVGCGFVLTFLLCAALGGEEGVQPTAVVEPLRVDALNRMGRAYGETWYPDGYKLTFEVPADAAGEVLFGLRSRLLLSREGAGEVPPFVLETSVLVAWSFEVGPGRASGERELEIEDDVEAVLALPVAAGSRGTVKVRPLRWNIALSHPREQRRPGTQPAGGFLRVPREALLGPWLRGASLGVLEALVAGAAAAAVAARFSTPVGLFAGLVMYLACLLQGPVTEFVAASAKPLEAQPALVRGHNHDHAREQEAESAAHRHEGEPALALSEALLPALRLLQGVLPDHTVLDGAGVLAAGEYVSWRDFRAGLASALPFIALFAAGGMLLFAWRDL